MLPIAGLEQSSRKLTNVEAIYDIGSRELLSIKEALRCHWLLFQVITDHKNLEYLKNVKRYPPSLLGIFIFYFLQDRPRTVKLTPSLATMTMILPGGYCVGLRSPIYIPGLDSLLQPVGH